MRKGYSELWNCNKITRNIWQISIWQHTNVFNYCSFIAALICLHNFITSTLDKKSRLGVLILAYDFTKAFDQLGHDVIIKTLADNNFPLPLIYWVSDYLHGRKQMVKIFNSVSKPLFVNSGVPQGSMLGPFLFNLVVGSLKPLNESTRIIKSLLMIVPLSSQWLKAKTQTQLSKNIKTWKIGHLPSVFS